MKRVFRVGIVGIWGLLIVAGLNIADHSITSMTLESRGRILAVSVRDDALAVSLLGEEHQITVPVAAWLEQTALVIQGIKAWVQQ